MKRQLQHVINYTDPSTEYLNGGLIFVKEAEFNCLQIYT